ncbi:MAG: hypothetical protein FJ091_12110 [Deltaproteobacteria bacterium]|nr:hypothetical protein [Deltaproteobacteria bacterium]
MKKKNPKRNPSGANAYTLSALMHAMLAELSPSSRRRLREGSPAPRVRARSAMRASGSPTARTA